jgi:hypothetical protein
LMASNVASTLAYSHILLTTQRSRSRSAEALQLVKLTPLTGSSLLVFEILAAALVPGALYH